MEKNAISEKLKAWYTDSLSLLTPTTAKANIAELQIASLKHQHHLGIMIASPNGDSLWSSGNCDACKAFIANKGVGEIAQAGILVEQFHDGLIIASGTNEIFYVIYFDGESLPGILQASVPGIRLSNSELHLLMQILCGLSLRGASEADKVAYETKRSQFKSLAARTGFRTQTEVVRSTLLALTCNVLESASNFTPTTPDQHNESEAFLNRYYPGIFRTCRITTGEGESLWVAETGPLTGTPVVWLHSQTLPTPGQFLTDWTSQKNIRLIIPFREGFLGAVKKPFTPQKHLRHCTLDIVQTIDIFCGGRAHVVANSTGSPYAVSLAADYPDRVERLTFCASAYVGSYANQPVRRLTRGVKNLFLTNEFLIEKMFERYLLKMSNPTGLLEILKSAYQNSPRDMEIFTELISSPIGHSWIYESYRMSRHSVVMDIAMSSNDVWQHAHKISCPVLFVHGRSDPINSVVDARKVSDLITNSQFVEIEEEGQSLFISRLAEIILLGS